MEDHALAEVLIALGILVDLWGLFVLFAFASYPPCAPPVSGPPTCGVQYAWGPAAQCWAIGSGLIACGLAWRLWERRSLHRA